ncbi:hypothetical protein ABT369_08270 [Dactylosporangium sp. NPDC000244]|uniref:hypothetical protein n=1 Tax=Dactylosporangium sp. NPDC000244 TaxID=3154365 RepID=UPI00332317BE
MDRLTSYTDAYQPQPLPGPLAAGPRPTDPQAVVLAAVWLLAAWSPAAGPGWRADFAHAGTFDGDPVEDVAALLAEWIPAADDRGRALREFLAGELASRYVQLRREPGDDLVLLLHDWKDRTLRITIAAAPTVAPPPEGSRIPCLLTLLSDQLWINNNDPVTFRVFLGEPDAHAGPGAWWTATREEPDEEAPDFRAYSPDDIRTALLNVARGGLNDLGADRDGDGDYPALPEDHIAAHLTHDLLDVLLERVRPVAVHGTGYLPVDWDEQDGDAEIGTVVLTGARSVAVLDVDVSC